MDFCNVNSIFNKIHILSDFLFEHRLDIFGAAETWLLPDVPDSFVAIDNYTIVRSDTPGDARKHGMCVYVKRHKFYIFGSWLQ